MIQYVIAENPDDRVLERCKRELEAGNLICFPTDSNWVMGASPLSKSGVDSLYRMKGEGKGKHFTMICNCISTASRYAEISNSTFRMINRVVPGPYTFIFQPTGSIPTPIKHYKKEKQIGVRFPKNHLARKIVEYFGEPIITSSINRKMIDRADEHGLYHDIDMIYSYELEDLFSNDISLIVDPGEIEFGGASTIIDFSEDGTPKLIREGDGDLRFFGLA